ncbi:MAG: glycosyltransferase family 4 protein [Acidobacteriota bacterium]
MRILTLAPHPFFQDRGTPIAVRLLVTVLAAAGHEVDLLTFHEGKDVPLANVRLHRIPALPGVRNIRPGFSLKKVLCDLVLLWRCVSLVRAGRYQLVHAVEESVFIALLVKKLFGIPYLYDMDSSMWRQLQDKYRWLRLFRGLLSGCERAAIRQSAGVVAVCRSLEEEALRHQPSRMVLRLEDISLLAPVADSGTTMDADLGVPRPFALYVGNLESYQGIDLLIESMRILATEGSPGNLALVGGNDADIERYRWTCREMGIEDRVFLLGRRPIEKLGSLLAQADVLVSPRIHGDNTPMKIYSYLDAGKPIVATRLPTHTQVLDDEVACLVDPDPVSFCAGLAAVFRDREWAAVLGRHARVLAQREFTRAAFERKLTGFYQLLAAGLAGKDAGAAAAPAEKG